MQVVATRPLSSVSSDCQPVGCQYIELARSLWPGEDLFTSIVWVRGAIVYCALSPFPGRMLSRGHHGVQTTSPEIAVTRATGVRLMIALLVGSSCGIELLLVGVASLVASSCWCFRPHLWRRAAGAFRCDGRAASRRRNALGRDRQAFIHSLRFQTEFCLCGDIDS